MTLPPLPQGVLERIAEAYRAWGLSVAGLGETPTNAASLRETLRTAEAMLPLVACRTAPSSFDPEDSEMLAFPRPTEARWRTLEEAWAHARPRAVMTRLPPFWQLEPAIHAACRTRRIPVFVGDPENIPVSAAALVSSDVDTVLTEASDAHAFATYLQEKRVPLPRVWTLIHRLDAPAWTVPFQLLLPGTAVFQEVHLMPGVVLLWQCPALASAKIPAFHKAESYLWETIDGFPHLTSLDTDPLPLVRLQVPLPLKEDSVCSCGKPIVVAPR